jgi:lipopolysaccharide/colanic/teichoic acid biosynthesis glycosyltransferase
MMMQERIDRSHAAPPSIATDAALRVADIATAAGMILLFLPMIGLVAAFSGKAGHEDAGIRRALHRFRADQLLQLFGVMRGQYSFYRTGNRPRAFSD